MSTESGEKGREGIDTETRREEHDRNGEVRRRYWYCPKLWQKHQNTNVQNNIESY